MILCFVCLWKGDIDYTVNLKIPTHFVLNSCGGIWELNIVFANFWERSTAITSRRTPPSPPPRPIPPVYWLTGTYEEYRTNFLWELAALFWLLSTSVSEVCGLWSHESEKAYKSVQYSKKLCLVSIFCLFWEDCAGILEQAMGARNREVIGLSLIRPARLHRLADSNLQNWKHNRKQKPRRGRGVRQITPCRQIQLQINF